MVDKSKNPKLLNLGCGAHYHPQWVNVDLISRDSKVIQHNLFKDLPFPCNSFDAVYHSHVLEHFPTHAAPNFIKECFRVLDSGGIIRVAVPNLEVIVRLYLEYLDQAIQKVEGSEQKYNWIMLEMLDQIVRAKSGGEMGEYLKSIDVKDFEFVYSRIGLEVNHYLNIKNESILNVITRIKPNSIKHLLWIKLVEICAVVLGEREAYLAFKEGEFRRSGENHYWMYDRFSLERLFKQAGFSEIQVCRADESRIDNFQHYQLDVVGGVIRKPDSLFMEGRKL